MEEFVACFAEIVDPRQDNARHDLHELLLIALCTMLTGGQDFSDMALFGEIKTPFLRKFPRLRHGIPSHDTFSRVFRLLDPGPFEACFTRFMQHFAEALQGVVAIDGKTLRRSFDRAAGKSPLHMLHAWSAEQRLLLGQLAVDGKSNEITAVPKLLDLLSLKGCIATADALNCQRTIAAKVIEQGGDYVLALKGNQGTGRILHVRRSQVDHQQSPVRVHRDVSLAAFSPLGGIVATTTGRVRRLDRLAVQHTCARAGFATGLLAVEHQGDVVDSAEQQAAHEAAEPPVDRLPWAEVHRQHAPASTGAGHIADRVQHLAQIHLGLPSTPGRLGQQRSDPVPFGVGQVSRVTATVLEGELPLTMLLGPHSIDVGRCPC